MALFDNGILRGDAGFGFRAADSGVVLYGSEGMKHDDMRALPGFLRPHAEHSGQPVVAVNEIIFEAMERSELLQFPEKIFYMRNHFRFRLMVVVPKAQMNQPHAWIELHNSVAGVG